MPASYERRSAVLRAMGALLLFFPGVLLLPGVVVAQEASESPAAALAEDSQTDQRAHLWRVGAWGAANVAGGMALIALSDAETQRFRRAFGTQSAVWGAVNVGIASVALLTGPGDVPAGLADALGAESGYGDILLVNLGLNVGYAAVGTSMMIAGAYDVRRAEDWRGHGAALILQGAGLFVLDGIAYLGSRARMNALVDLASSATLSASADGVRLVVGL